MSEEMKMDAERARVVDAMCMTWRHDFGLDKREHKLGSCGMTDEERDALRRQMCQLYDHHFAQARARLPVGVPDGLRIAIQQRDHYAARVGALELGLLRIADDFYPDNDSEMALALGEMREAVRSLVAAAPTVKESLSVAPTVKAEQWTDGDNIKHLTDCDVAGCGRCENLMYFYQACDECGAWGHNDAGPCACLKKSPSLPAAGSAVEEVEVVAHVLNKPKLQRVAWLTEAGKRLAHKAPLMTVAQHERIVATQQSSQPELTVWEGQMPESNGKSNFTAVLMRKGAGLFDGIAGGMTIARSEYPDRVRYEADCVRWLIGELDEQPCIIDYDADKHSGYAAQHSAPERVSVPVELVEKAMLACFEVGHGVTHDALRALLSRNGNGGE